MASIPNLVSALIDAVYGTRRGEAWIEWGAFDQNNDFVRSGAARAADIGAVPDNVAVFWSVGLLKAGTTRNNVSVESVRVFVADDVGRAAKSKIDPDLLEMVMPEPTIRVESSPGNWQWQWGITDGLDVATYAALRRGIPFQSDATAPSNLVRLPMGVSGKAGVTHRVRGLPLGPVYSGADFIAKCGGLTVTPASVAQSAGALKAPGLYAVKAALAALPNDGVSVYCADHNRGWIPFGMALYGATGGEGLALWQEWNKGQPQKRDLEYVWNSFHDTGIGWVKLKWLAMEHGRAAFEAAMAAAAPGEFDDNAPPPEPEPPPFTDASAFRLTDPKKIPRRPWLYGRRLMRGYVSATIAAGGVGKSSLVMTEIMSMVSGMELMREKPRAPLRVWLWNGEDDLTELRRRLHGICLRYGINDHDLGDRLYVDSGREKQIVIAGPDGRGAAVNNKVVDAIKAVIKARKIDVLVLDPFVSAHRVSENDNMAIDMVAKTLARIADECFCAVDIVHHIRKPGNGATGAASVDDARGASALINATRHSRVLTPMPPAVAAKLGVANHRAYFAVQHDATKANMVPPSVGADWYHFENVGLGNEDPSPADGLGREEQDYVGVVERWDPPSTTVSEDPAKARAAQDEIAKGVFRSSEKASDWVGPVIARALGVDMSEDGNKKLVRDTQAIWVRKGWLKVSKRKDASRHEVDFIEVGDRPSIDAFEDDLTS